MPGLRARSSGSVRRERVQLLRALPDRRAAAGRPFAVAAAEGRLAEVDRRLVRRRRRDSAGATRLPAVAICFVINACRFIDMKQASALYRLLGDDARLRLLRVLATRAPERHRADRRPRAGPVGRLAPPRAPEGRRTGREENDGGFTYYRLAPVAPTATTRALGRCSGAVRRAASRSRVRADEARLRKCCGSGRRTSTRTSAPDTPRRAAAGARPQLGGVVARARASAAAARGRRSRLRRRY